VATDNLIDGTLHRGNIQPPFQQIGMGMVEVIDIRISLMLKPKMLLLGGERICRPDGA